MSVTKELIIARSCNSDPASVFFLDLSGQRVRFFGATFDYCPRRVPLTRPNGISLNSNATADNFKLESKCLCES
jgi:hypothetical protein